MTKLKYGKKDGITGIKRGKYANTTRLNVKLMQCSDVSHYGAKTLCTSLQVLTWQGGKWR